MISKIIHLADLHLRKSIQRNEEYEYVFNNLYKSLDKIKPDRIVIVGDLFHDFIDLQGEVITISANLLNKLSNFAKVIIIRGNHDIRKSNLQRIDSIEAITKAINNPNIVYLNETGFYDDENVTWCVWKYADKQNNPWIKFKKYQKKEGQIYIDLFHNPINGCLSTSNYEFNSNVYYKLSDFRGHYLFAGDIHLQQYLNKQKTAAYCGSLIAQDFSEGDNNFHGFLLWNILDKTIQEIPIENEWSFKTIKINPYTDFQNLDIEIDNPTKYMRIRIVWQTLPAYRNKENERLLLEYLKNKYGESIISIKHKNEFIEEDKIDSIENTQLININDPVVQHQIFKDYLSKIGVNDKDIDEILKIDNEISSRIVVEEISNIEWNIIRYSAKNFMSYENIDIELNNDGIYQIVGDNTNGKTTVSTKILTYILFGETIETSKKVKFGDHRFISNKLDTNFCEGSMIIQANNKYYGIKRKTTRITNKQNEITSCPTTLNYYLLNSSNDEMNDNNNINKLNDEDRKKTQKVIESVIGTYDNFLRLSIVTADKLNDILSQDYATFLDNLLNDSGLDIFEKKLDALKEYQKELNSKSRITCNVENVKKDIGEKELNNKNIQLEIDDIDNIKIPELNKRIRKGNEYIEDLFKKIFKIDPEISNLNINDANKKILEYEKNIESLNQKKIGFENNIKLLKETYDEKALNDNLLKKDEHKTTENKLKLEIKNIENNINSERHKIEIINGEIFNLKKEGGKLKEQIAEKNKEIEKLKASKLEKHPICITCKQGIVPEHLKHIDENIEEINSKIKLIINEMLEKAKEIKIRENEKIPTINIIIDNYKNDIVNINEKIKQLSIEMDLVLKKIGELTNDKNDVEKRKQLQQQLDQIPILIENDNLKINTLKDKIKQYNNLLVQIEDNKKTESIINNAKERVLQLNNELDRLKSDKSIKINEINNNILKIKENNNLIIEFEKQEKRDSLLNYYKKGVCRDGVPFQLLSNNIIPKINNEMNDLLKDISFNIWLDPEEIKPKLAYNDFPNAIIDAIGSSGKERTFSALALKYALYQINNKSKSSILLLDEISGKLINNSCEEFVTLLHLIAKKIKKIFIIEHNIEINPDYIISTNKNENGISNAIIE